MLIRGAPSPASKPEQLVMRVRLLLSTVILLGLLGGLVAGSAVGKRPPRPDELAGIKAALAQKLRNSGTDPGYLSCYAGFAISTVDPRFAHARIENCEGAEEGLLILKRAGSRWKVVRGGGFFYCSNRIVPARVIRDLIGRCTKTSPGSQFATPSDNIACELRPDYDYGPPTLLCYVRSLKTKITVYGCRVCPSVAKRAPQPGYHKYIHTPVLLHGEKWKDSEDTFTCVSRPSALTCKSWSGYGFAASGRGIRLLSP